MTKERLVELIKKGMYKEQVIGTDLLGENIYSRGYVKLSFTQLQDLASQWGITEEEFSNIICREGGASLLWQALETSRDFNRYAGAWFKKDGLEHDLKLKRLKELGASESLIYTIESLYDKIDQNSFISPEKGINMFNNEEDFVKFYLFGDTKRLLRAKRLNKITVEPNESLLGKLFDKYKIDINKYGYLIKEIGNSKIYVDAIKALKTNGLEYVKHYFEKFHEIAPIEEYFRTQLMNPKWVYEKFSGKISKEKQNYVDDLVQIYKLVLEGDYPIMQKLNFICFCSEKGSTMKDYGFYKNMGFLRDIGVVKARSLKDLFEEQAGHLALEYLKYLGNISYITSKNKGNFAFPMYYAPTPKNESNCTYSFLRAFRKEAQQLIYKGYLQEYAKFLYVNKSKIIDSTNEDYFIEGESKHRVKDVREAYENSEAYKKCPVPFDYIYGAEMKRIPQWPHFILIRNALKNKDFNKALLGEEMFYREGFSGRAFATSNQQWAQKNGYSSGFAKNGAPKDTLSDPNIDMSAIYEDIDAEDIEYASENGFILPIEDENSKSETKYARKLKKYYEKYWGNNGQCEPAPIWVEEATYNDMVHGEKHSDLISDYDIESDNADRALTYKDDKYHEESKEEPDEEGWLNLISSQEDVQPEFMRYARSKLKTIYEAQGYNGEEIDYMLSNYTNDEIIAISDAYTSEGERNEHYNFAPKKYIGVKTFELSELSPIEENFVHFNDRTYITKGLNDDELGEVDEDLQEDCEYRQEELEDSIDEYEYTMTEEDEAQCFSEDSDELMEIDEYLSSVRPSDEPSENKHLSSLPSSDELSSDEQFFLDYVENKINFFVRSEEDFEFLNKDEVYDFVLSCAKIEAFGSEELKLINEVLNRKPSPLSTILKALCEETGSATSWVDKDHYEKNFITSDGEILQKTGLYKDWCPVNYHTEKTDDGYEPQPEHDEDYYKDIPF